MSDPADEVALSMWVIYDHPTDYPEFFVARRHEVRAAGPVATDECFFTESLEYLRQTMVMRGLTVLARLKGDDPKIIEVWL